MTVDPTAHHAGQITVENNGASQTVSYDNARWEALTHHLLGVLSQAPSSFTVNCGGSARVFGEWHAGATVGVFWVANLPVRCHMTPTTDELGDIYAALGP